jgi:hypothetical protein
MLTKQICCESPTSRSTRQLQTVAAARQADQALEDKVAVKARVADSVVEDSVVVISKPIMGTTWAITNHLPIHSKEEPRVVPQVADLAVVDKVVADKAAQVEHQEGLLAKVKIQVELEHRLRAR